MNGLNGGYVMIDLSIAGTELLKVLSNAEKANKPILLYDGSTVSYAILEHEANSDYNLYLANGTYKTVNRFSGGVVTYELLPKHRHLVTLTGTISDVSHTFTFSFEDRESTAYTTTNKGLMLSKIRGLGYDSATNNRVWLVAESAGKYALIYVDVVGGASKLYAKLASSSTFTEVLYTSIEITDVVRNV